MFKNKMLVWVALMHLVYVSGCGTIPLPGPAPEGFYENDVLKAQVGEHKKSVLARIGVPTYILNIDEKSYWIYEARSRAIGIPIFVIPIPVPATRKDGEFHCLLLEFDRDNNLQRYESKTDTLIENIPIDYGCACTFFPKKYTEWNVRGRNFVCTADRMQFDPSAQKEIEFLQAKSFFTREELDTLDAELEAFELEEEERRMEVLQGKSDVLLKNIKELLEKAKQGDPEAQYNISSAQVATYSIKDLGTLGGDSYGTDINNSGQVTGYSFTTRLQLRAFLYDNGTMQDLGTLGGYMSIGRRINDSGQVTGFSNTTRLQVRAFLYDNGTMQDLGTLGGHSYGHDINNNGQVTGFSKISGSNDRHAFLYDNGTMQDLGTLGGHMSIGRRINDSGQVTGYSVTTGGQTRAFLYDNGTMQDLGTLGGDSYGHDINNSGQVTGYSVTTGGQTRAFLYDNGTMQDLGTLGGDSVGQGINNNGQVVGSYNNSKSAFFYDGSNMLDLCILTDCIINGWDDLNSASAINDNGDITGWGTINGETHAFIISSVPIPPAI